MQIVYQDYSPSPKELPAGALPLPLVVLSTAVLYQDFPWPRP